MLKKIDPAVSILALILIAVIAAYSGIFHNAFLYDDEFLIQVTFRNRRHNFDDTSHLFGQIRGHEIHVVG